MFLVFSNQTIIFEEKVLQSISNLRMQIAKILNEIEKLAIGFERRETDRTDLETKLDEYIDHVKKHFVNEERLMEQYDFPSYEMHKMAHDMFLIDLKYATRQWKEFGDINKIIMFVYKTPEWIVMHVNSVDAPTANYLATKMEEG